MPFVSSRAYASLGARLSLARKDIGYSDRNGVKQITQFITNPKASTQKEQHLQRAAELLEQARIAIEQAGDWQRSGSLILQSLAEERKASDSGLQVMNVIKSRPKTRLEFNFRS